MGITQFSLSLIEKYRGNAKDVVDLGAQNLYIDSGKAPYASEWYESKGLLYNSIDLSGENGCIVWDLSKIYDPPTWCDLVTDFGTSEHIGKDGKYSTMAIYNCWKNKHDLLKPGGVMINENPKTGNWPLHGFNYYTQEFYFKLAELCYYDILEIGEHPAMGNTNDGWNVYCVLKKGVDREFISIEEFETCGILQS